MPALAAALWTALKSGGRDFAGAFDLLLAGAPHERLSALLAERRRTGTPGRRAGALAAGGDRRGHRALRRSVPAAGYLVPLVTGLVQPVQVAEAPNWRQAVAEYMGFMTPETLAVIPDNPTVLADELSAVGQKIALDLTRDRLALPDVDAQARLALCLQRQAAGPACLSVAVPTARFAFCIIANGKPDARGRLRSSARASTSSSGTATASATC